MVAETQKTAARGRIDADLDERLTLAQAAAELPRRRAGKATATATLYRWTTDGCRGIKLEFEQIGATRCVTRRALAEFFDALTRKAKGEPEDGPTPVRTSAGRQRAAEAADRELARLGL